MNDDNLYIAIAPKKRNPEIHAACSSTTKGDGLWNDEKGCWHYFPCIGQHCPRHWRRFARKLYRRHKHKMRADLTWYHIIIPLRCWPSKSVGNRHATRFVDGLAQLYPESTITYCKHNGKKGIHYHIALGKHGPIDCDAVTACWHQHAPRAAKKQWTHKSITIKYHRHPRRLLAYILGLSLTKPRWHPPWRGLGRRNFWIKHTI